MVLNMLEMEGDVATLWDKVCRNINHILKECQLYGLVGILEIPDPSIEARLSALRRFESAYATIISALECSDDSKHAEDGVDSHKIMTTMINAKQQLFNLERLLNAAKSKDDEAFEEARLRLEKQAQH